MTVLLILTVWSDILSNEARVVDTVQSGPDYLLVHGVGDEKDASKRGSSVHVSPSMFISETLISSIGLYSFSGTVEKRGMSVIYTMIIHSKEQEVIRMGMECCNEEARDVYMCLF
jgi:hypothetical protein